MKKKRKRRLKSRAGRRKKRVGRGLGGVVREDGGNSVLVRVVVSNWAEGEEGGWLKVLAVGGSEVEMRENCQLDEEKGSLGEGEDGEKGGESARGEVAVEASVGLLEE